MLTTNMTTQAASSLRMINVVIADGPLQKLMPPQLGGMQFWVGYSAFFTFQKIGNSLGRMPVTSLLQTESMKNCPV